MGSVVTSLAAPVTNLFSGGGGGARAELSRDRTEYADAVAKRVQPSRDSTLRLIEELRLRAQGQGAPTLAQSNLASANRRNLAQTLSAASAMRGVPQGALQRQVQRQKGAGQRNLAEQNNLLKLQEQAVAQDQLANLSLAQQQESLQQVTQPGAVSAGAAATRFAEDTKREEDYRKNLGRELGAITGAAGVGTAAGTSAGALASDEKLKKHVEGAKQDVKKFLDAVSAKKYEYKDTSKPGTAPGERFGVIAQDLEKSEMGKSLVKDTPQGKMVDTAQGFGALLAAQAEMHERLKKLEKGKK